VLRETAIGTAEGRKHRIRRIKRLERELRPRTRDQIIRNPVHYADSMDGEIGNSLTPDNSCQLNRSTQHFLEVYSQEFEVLKFFWDADLIVGPLYPDPLAYSRTDRFSEGGIVVITSIAYEKP
jgi:hypothetical protein